ncbi:hypothetical protein SLEP1_g31627 [Rubroshorea leprosula]|uniref:Uncharacterized protein n=1 Tax=Rubroshorea leprosula TaxID=152421 RepID=A0AAV5KB98_9ROSI|nr:hypothetical protein SLEP1_g31627 [Rubroshorea leprosula]
MAIGGWFGFFKLFRSVGLTELECSAAVHNFWSVFLSEM